MQNPNLHFLAINVKVVAQLPQLLVKFSFFPPHKTFGDEQQ